MWRILASLLILAFLAKTAVANPLALHPENGHYFLWRGKPTVLITSGEHYGAVLNLDFDFETYLRTLAQDGLNHTRIFSGTYREVGNSFGITNNTLTPKPERFASPWARSAVPGYADGGNKFDLNRYDEDYFQRLRRFLKIADQLGIVVELNLFCPLYHKEIWAVSPLNVVNNINGIGDCPRDETLTLKHPAIVAVQVALTEKIVREVNSFDNLYFEICNEPYVRKVPDDWQHKIVDTILATEKDLPQKHLVSLNVANGRKRIDHPYPGVSIFNFHYCVPPDVVAMNFALNKVIGENETGFRGKHDYLYRNEAWNFLLAGGGLYNNLDYSFTPQHPDGTFRDYASPGGGSPELRQQLGVLKKFFDGLDFIRMKPNSDVIRAVPAGLEARALAEAGRSYAVYVSVPVANKPKRIEDHLREGIQARLTLELPPGGYRVQWWSTQSGPSSKLVEVEHAGGNLDFESPEFANDVALHIVAIPGRKELLP